RKEPRVDEEVDDDEGGDGDGVGEKAIARAPAEPAIGEAGQRQAYHVLAGVKDRLEVLGAGEKGGGERRDGHGPHGDGGALGEVGDEVDGAPQGELGTVWQLDGDGLEGYRGQCEADEGAPRFGRKARALAQEEPKRAGGDDSYVNPQEAIQ